MIIDNTGVKIKSIKDFLEVQEIAFELGIKWQHMINDKKQYLFFNSGRIDYGCVLQIKNKILTKKNVHNCKLPLIFSNEYITKNGVEEDTIKIINL